jgi:UDP-N-acetylmuramate dehydrogenase
MNHSYLRRIIDACAQNSSCSAEIRFDEPMSAHTSFKVGGPADCWLRPRADGFPEFVAALIAAACKEGLPLFFLGGGANVLVSDKGIRGLVLDTSGWSGEIKADSQIALSVHALAFRSGTGLDDAAEAAALRGLGGLEFLSGMPGSIGGALWMNARAYEREIADVLARTEALDFSSAEMSRQPLQAEALQAKTLQADKAEFAYKRSPFQNRRCFILSAEFGLYPRSEKEIRKDMEEHRRDREDKGHYRYPSAGSAFKNNRDFGKPVGKIIDELGLRGLSKGGAQIAPYHGNIIINTGGARAAEIRALLDETAAKVKEAAGFTLEPEILFVGEW